MRLLQRTDMSTMAKALDGGARFDYLYMYPPRQAYRPFADGVDPESMVASALRSADTYNLYVHFPFCRQICEYCNLYAVASRNDSTHRRYCDAVKTELDRRSSDLEGSARTVYFGGGTPSMLSAELLGETLAHAAAALSIDLAQVREIAIEVAPDTASPEKLAGLKAVGFNRVNLGVQSAAADELLTIGRRHGSGIVADALADAVDAGFDNVCADLIFGLPGQTMESWRRSVDFVIERRPHTICAYGLTLRPNTGFAHRGVPDVEELAQSRKWDLANAALLEAGYERQTHVRWALPGRGGYLQKEYHWAGETLLGIGAGARSYLWDLDTRNGYSLRRRASALDQYFTAVEADQSPITDGFVMDDEERMRKAIVLGLNRLDTTTFERRFGTDPRTLFPEEVEVLTTLGLLEDTGSALRLTEAGVRHRDLAVQPFVSERVRALVASFTYNE